MTAKTKEAELERVRKAFLRHTIELFERDQHIIPVSVLMSWKQPGEENFPDGGYAFAMIMEDPIGSPDMLDDNLMDVIATMVGKTNPEAVFVVGEMLGTYHKSKDDAESFLQEVVARGDDPRMAPPEATRMLILQLETHEKTWLSMIHIDEEAESGKRTLRQGDCEWDEGADSTFRFLDGEAAKKAEN